MKKLTVRNRIIDQAHVLNSSLQKKYKTERKSIQDIKIPVQKRNIFNFTQRQRADFKLSHFSNLTFRQNFHGQRQNMVQTKKLVNKTINNSFHKSLKLRTQPSNNLKINNSKNISIHQLDINYYSSQKNLKKFIKRPFLSIQCKGPSFWTYDPKPQKFMTCNQLNLKNQFNPQSLKFNSQSQQKSQNFCTEKIDVEKGKRKLKKKATFSNFLTEGYQENHLQKQKSLQIKSHEKRKRNYQQDQYPLPKKRNSKNIENIQQLETKNKKSIFLTNPLKKEQIDKVYQNQKRKYHIRQSSCGFINTIKIADILRTHFDDQAKNQDENYFMIK